MLQRMLIALLLGFATINLAQADDTARLATVCASCHGLRGEGNQALGAPRLAGQDAAYIARQLKNFKLGKRAYSPQDASGIAMRSVAKGMDDADIQQLAAYYSHLDSTRHLESEPQHIGVKAGEELYRSTCAECHGLHAQGYPQLQAPNLNILDGGYIARQLESFAKGWRGDAEQSDQPAVWMRSIASHISTPRELAEVIQYITSLLPAADGITERK